MSDVVISVESLGKKYRIRHQQRERYTALRDVLARRVFGIGSSVLDIGRHLVGLNGTANGHDLTPNTQHPAPKTEEFWALKNVNFEVRRGEVVGLIGPNGAGKSTLLKIISRITEPTEGRILIRGRVASLLEVGTGFHPELTGRQNIYLNGAILGMTREEIKAHFDEIVAFAEVERFLETPVKHYSSGMYVRLAFAVAAHLEPENLLVDEVLAVGDAAFQKKCLGKMGAVAKQGRTVLFVSHNMTAVLNLCNRGISLEDGGIVAMGAISKVVEQYLTTALSVSTVSDLSNHQRDGSGRIRFKEFVASDERGNPWIYPDRPAVFKMKLEVATPDVLSSHVTIAIGVSATTGERLIELHTKFDKNFQGKPIVFGQTTTVVCKVDRFPIKPASYYLTLYVAYRGELCDRILEGIRVEVREADYFGTGATLSHTQGWFMLDQQWSCQS